MYGVVKNVINAKRYELTDMLKKIDTFWAQGIITEEQRTELVSLAQNNAKVENSVDILKKLEELDKRVTALEKAKAPVEDEAVGDESAGDVIEGETAEGETTEGESTELEESIESETVVYPDYVVGKWYYRGDVVAFNGKNYTCIAPDGVVCVWSPTEYPVYWEQITE